MSKDKQIEEMQNTLIRISKQPIMIDGLEHWSDVIAEELYNADYRKASEVAREIFEEIEEIAMHGTTPFGLCLMSMGEGAFAELKKKYTEEGK